MRTRTVITSLIVAGIAFSAFAAEKIIKEIPASARKARIDAMAKNGKFVLKPAKSMRVAGWMKGLKSHYVYSESKPLTVDKWEDYVVEFTPQADGVVSVIFRGLWWRAKGNKKHTPIFVLFDDIKITGAELKNPDFAKLDKKGKPADWNFKGKIVKDDTATGKTAAKIGTYKMATQAIKVKKGQKVTIKTKVKYAK
jgi:hypothetical protein